MKKYEEDWDDIQEALGKVSYDFVPEQERRQRLGGCVHRYLI